MWERVYKFANHWGGVCKLKYKWRMVTCTCHFIIDHINYFTSLSCQNINFQKSKVFFSKFWSPAVKHLVTTSFNIPESHNFDKYLGFLIFNSKPIKRDFQFFLDNFKTGFAGWKTNLLSMAGRTTLIKAALNSLPNHVMQITNLPIQLLNQLQRYQRNFLWGTTHQKRKLHSVRWERVTTSKVEGGLDIQRLKEKNQALLANTAWRLFHNPSFFMGILISEYISPNTHHSCRPSRTWKNILLWWSACQQGLVWRISTGTNVQFWNDPWLGPRLILRHQVQGTLLL